MEKFDISSITTSAVKVFLDNIKNFMPIQIAFSIPLQVLLFLFAFLVGFDLPITPLRVIGTIILVTVAFLQICLINVIVMMGINQYKNGQKFAFKTCLKKSISKLLPNFIAVILLCLMIISGLVLFIIPGFYMAIRFSLIMEAITFEDKSIIGSFKRSWELTRGNTWQVAGIIAVMSIIVNIADKILADSQFLSLPYINYVFSFLIKSLTYNFSYIIYYVFYLEIIKQEESDVNIITTDSGTDECSNKIELSFE